MPYSRIDKLDIKEEAFYGGNVLFLSKMVKPSILPGVNCDVVFIFTHILQHFLKAE